MVGVPDGHFRLANQVNAIDGAVIRVQPERPTVHRLVADLALLPAQVLPQRPGIVQAPGHLRGQRFLLAVVLIEARLANEALATDPPIRRAKHGATVRQEGAGGAAVVLLHVGHQRPFELLVGAPSQRRHEQQAVVLGVVDLGLAVALDRHHAVEQCAFIIQRTGAVEGDLLAVEAAVLQLQLAFLLSLRTLADEIEQAANRALPVEHRGRPLQYLDPLKGVRIRAGIVVVAHTLLQAVEKDARRCATYQCRIAAAVQAISLATHAGHVAQRILYGQRALVADAVGGDHADRLRGFDDRRVGLGGADATLGDIALDRTIAALGLARCGDLLRFELDCFLSLDGKAGDQHWQAQHQRAQRKRRRSDNATHGVLP